MDQGQPKNFDILDYEAGREAEMIDICDVQGDKLIISQRIHDRITGKQSSLTFELDINKLGEILRAFQLDIEERKAASSNIIRMLQDIETFKGKQEDKNV